MMTKLSRPKQKKKSTGITYLDELSEVKNMFTASIKGGPSDSKSD
jgi:hypothetical protein